MPEAITSALQALEIQERIGNIRESIMSAVNLGISLHSIGKYQEAAAYLERALEKLAVSMIHPIR